MMQNPFVLAADDPESLLKILKGDPSIASVQDQHGYSLVHAAASYNHLDLLRAVVRDYGAPVDMRDEDGETALFVVETVEAARVLVEELGANVLNINSEAMTAGQKFAAEGEYPEVAEYLAEKEKTAPPKPRGPPQETRAVRDQENPSGGEESWRSGGASNNKTTTTGGDGSWRSSGQKNTSRDNSADSWRSSGGGQNRARAGSADSQKFARPQKRSTSGPAANRPTSELGDTIKPSLPEGVKVTMGTMDETEADGLEPDPALRRKIEELALRDDFQTPEAQAELRKLVEEVVLGKGGVATEEQKENARQD